MKILFFISFILATGFCEAQKIQKQLPDSVQIKNSIVYFYKWYVANWKKMGQFKLYQSKKANGGPPYLINWKEVEGYFTVLRKNVPFLGEAYYKDERKNFKDIDAEFLRYPEDEIPPGFDYDRFTNTQEEPDWFWMQLNKRSNKWAIEVSGNKATIVVHAPENKKDSMEAWDVFCGTAVKEKGVWKIARLACEATILETNQLP